MENAMSASTVSRYHLRFDSDAEPGVRKFLHEHPEREEGQAKRTLRWGTVCCLGFALLGMSARGQQDTTAPANSAAPAAQSSSGMPHPPSDPDPIGRHIEQHMAERRNSERQKTLIADTDKLLALAQQLKADVDKSDKDILSIDVVKRAEQIEKLARSVKEKMRGS